MIVQGGTLRGVTVMKPATVQAMLSPQGVSIEHEGIPKVSVQQTIFWWRQVESGDDIATDVKQVVESGFKASGR